MIKKTSKISEFNHFTNLSDEWWKPDGKFKILHTLTPLRIKYIKRMCCNENYNFKTSNYSLKNLDILDLGCGGGLVCEPLARLGANITGFDFVKQNIDIAKKHAKNSNLNIKYYHQNLNTFKLNSKYDAILILEVLEHLDDWKKIILNVKNFLKPKGKIIISTINKSLLAKIFAIYLAENIFKWVPKKTHSFEKLIKPIELTSFLEKHKINVIDVTGLVFKPISFEWRLDKHNQKINYFCTAINSN